jgi:phosphoribosyl 1,2-cyclic phosphodiesterase
VRVTFWGTRGSIATPGPATNLYGGNTACVELRCGDDILIFDAGTGIRPLGLALMKEFGGRPFTLHVFISHTHWDHIQGFPFFLPAYSPLTTLHVYGSPGEGRPLERLIRGQMNPDYFPVALGDLQSTLDLQEFRGQGWSIGEATVEATYLNHPGMNLGYRVSHRGRAFVYATDNEPYRSTLEGLGQRAEAGREFGARLDEGFVRFVAGADLYVGEAQYRDDEYPARLGWGHSSVSVTVEVAIAAQVRALALFHHDPMREDAAVDAMVEAAQRLIQARGASIRCFGAQEGQTIEL